MASRHSRGPGHSRPRSNAAADDRIKIELNAIDRALIEGTGIYDASIDGAAMDAAAIEPGTIESGTVDSGAIDRVDGERPTHWVRVTCPACGVVRVLAERVVVRNCVDDQSWSYRARCSECDIIFIGFTPASLALPAVAAGLVVETWTLPTPSARHAGSALQPVDLLELHLALLETDWFEQLARVEPLGDR